MKLLLSEQAIRTNWDLIVKDPHNNRPDITTADDYIAAAKRGEVTAGGAEIVISNSLPGKGEI